MRLSGFDKVSWIKALKAGAEGQVIGAGWGEKATWRRLAAFIVCDGQCRRTVWLNAGHVMKLKLAKHLLKTQTPVLPL